MPNTPAGGPQRRLPGRGSGVLLAKKCLGGAKALLPRGYGRKGGKMVAWPTPSLPGLNREGGTGKVMVGTRPNGTSGHMKYVVPTEEAPPWLRLPEWPAWLVPGTWVCVQQREGVYAGAHWEQREGVVKSVTPQLVVINTGRYTVTFSKSDWWSRQIVLIDSNGNAVVPRRPPDLRAATAHGERRPKPLPLTGLWATLMPKGISLNKAASQTFAQIGIKRVKVETEGDALFILPDESGYMLSAKRKDTSWQYQFGSPALTRRLLEAGFAYGRYRLESHAGGFVGKWVEGSWGRLGSGDGRGRSERNRDL